MDKSKTIKKKKTYFEKYDLYSDANPKDTIKKLERIYKKGVKKHNRISQIANVLKQRLRVINKNDKRFKLAERYFDFLKERTKLKGDLKRKSLKFKV